MSVLPRLKEEKTKQGRMCMNVRWQGYELCSSAGRRQISALATSKHSCETLASPVTGIKTSRKIQKYMYFGK